ncbi:MAG: hypothetical protein ACREXW_16675 [Gammaproteobacteria bacterium]
MARQSKRSDPTCRYISAIAAVSLHSHHQIGNAAGVELAALLLLRDVPVLAEQAAQVAGPE